MRLRLIAAGGRMPGWVREGTEEYRKRLPRDFELSITEIPLAARGRNGDLRRAVAKEGEAMLATLGRGEHVVALDVGGRSFSTEALAERVRQLRDGGADLALLIGGPDGLAPACLARADERWSLSALTLPHPIVRIVVAEQLYRVWSFLNNHPYHRA